jgi:hypothetical protein
VHAVGGEPQVGRGLLVLEDQELEAKLGQPELSRTAARLPSMGALKSSGTPSTSASATYTTRFVELIASGGWAWTSPPATSGELSFTCGAAGSMGEAKSS